jgi:transcriptional regulator with XRE-family HTH domain
MTQKTLASKVGVSPGAVTAWVKGDYAPSHESLEAIVGALRVSMAEFYGRVPAAKKAKGSRARA